MFLANRNNQLFFGSLLAGILIWLFIYLIIPVKLSGEFHGETFLFILCNYLALIIGFVISRFRDKEVSDRYSHSILQFIIAILLVSFVLRWVDLFIVRELSFSYEPKVNREINNEMGSRSGIVFLLASVLKSAYFFPFIISLYKKNTKIIYKVLSYILLVLPLIEAVLRGNRKPFFEIFLIVLIGLIASKKLRIGLKQMAVSAVIFIVLMIISMVMVFDRENLNEKEVKFQLIDARYGEILQMKPDLKEYIQNPDEDQNKRMVVLSGMHFGQYITHGVFEFNHIIKNEDLPITYGAYTFNVFLKLLNRLPITEEIPLTNPSPRKHVYLTTFGGFFIDFRWFSLVIMFALGVIQKFAFTRSNKDVLFKPIVMYFLLLNFTFLVMNYIRGAGTYPILSILLLLLIVQFTSRRK